jgi:hypothetical protein
VKKEKVKRKKVKVKAQKPASEASARPATPAERSEFPEPPQFESCTSMAPNKKAPSSRAEASRESSLSPAAARAAAEGPGPLLEECNKREASPPRKAGRTPSSQSVSGQCALKAERSSAAKASGKDNEVLRLRLDKVDGEKEISPLASAQDDGALERGASTVAAARRAAIRAQEGSAAPRAAATQTDPETPANPVTVDRTSASPEPGAQRAGATGRTHREAMLEHWRKVRAGERVHEKDIERPKHRSANPLFDLPERERSQIFVWLRECPYQDAVQTMLRDRGLLDITRPQIEQFFEREAEHHWQVRLGRAATEANALVTLAEESPVKFSAGILAALGQEAFRQIASGDVAPECMGRIATLFLRARADERSDQMSELKREKLRHEIQDQVEHALEKLAEEVERHPEAKAAFDALRRELAEHAEENS